MDKFLTYSSIGIVALVGLGFGLSLRGRYSSPAPRAESSVVALTESEATEARSSVASTIPSTTVPTERPTTTPQGTVTAAPSAPTDADLMTQLRALEGASPLVALRLAREGNARFPNSPDAPERTWHIVKSLTDLGQFAEAREEAQRMLDTYPPSNWTSDIKRHVLSHPPNPPPTSAP